MAPDGKLPTNPVEAVAAYRVAAELASFAYELEDRFPEDQIRLLHQPLCAAALAVGARIAEGFGRDGLDPRGELSESTKRDARGKLSEMRHYVSVSGSRYFLDENHLRAFDELERRIQEALRSRPSHDEARP